MPVLSLRRTVIFLLAAAFCMALLISGTFAWQSISQVAIANASGAGAGPLVTLIKLEKDSAGNATKTPIAGAEFYLYQVAVPKDIQIGGRYESGVDGKIQLHLRPGDYYFLETDPGYGYTWDADSGGDIRRYPFTVMSRETSDIIVTAWNRRVTGKLILQKTVKNENGDPLTAAQRDTAFAFTVTFSDGGTYGYRIDGGPSTDLKSGSTLKLRHGQKAIFEDLPVGLQYTVFETPIPGYTIHSENHSGSIAEQGGTAAFVNTFRKAPGSLTVTKTVSGTAADVDKDFAFTITLGGIVQTFSLKHGERKVFDDLPIGTTYSIAEDDYTSDGYISNPGGYSGQATSGDVLLSFDNHRDDGSGGDGSLEVTKQVTGQGADPGREFSFIATIGAVEFPFTLTGGGRKEFIDLPAGTHYIITEKPEDGYTAAVTVAEGVIASNHRAKLTFVNDKTQVPKDAELIVRKKVVGDLPAGEENRLFHFILSVEGQEAVAFDLKAGDYRSFALSAGAIYHVAESDPFPAGYALTAVTGGGGTISEAQVTAEFTNTWVAPALISIRGEKIWDFGAIDKGPQSGGDLKDRPPVPASITLRLKKGDSLIGTAVVTPDKDGKWLYEWKVPKYEPDGKTEIKYTVEEEPVAGFRPRYEDTADGFVIRNTYIPPAVLAPLVQKVVRGDKPAKMPTFVFRLTAQKQAPMPRGFQGGSKTIAITGAGQAAFGEITYTKPGTYRYRMTEQNSGVKGWTYDDSVYSLTVTITEKDGRLTATQKLTRNGAAAKKAVFTNSCKADKATEPENPEDPDKPKSPPTGDTGDVGLWLLLLLLSGGLLAVLVRSKVLS
jgi:pilin isopeptide linkage protein